MKRLFLTTWFLLSTGGALVACADDPRVVVASSSVQRNSSTQVAQLYTQSNPLTPTTLTPTQAISPTLTPTQPISPTLTPTQPISPTLTLTPTISPTRSPTQTNTPTSTPTQTNTPTPTPTPTNTPRPTPTPVLRWEIIPMRLTESRAPEEGWKNLTIDLFFENKTSNYSAMNIRVVHPQVLTTINQTEMFGSVVVSPKYDLDVLGITGSNVRPVRAFAFQHLVPPGFRIRGEFQGDQVLSYYLRGKIPQTAKPIAVQIQDYVGDIALTALQPWSFPPLDENQFKVRGSQITIPQKGYLTIKDFTRIDRWIGAYDLIKAKYDLAGRDATKNVQMNLNFVPVDNDGIIGAWFSGWPECQMQSNLGPLVAKSGDLCFIVPHQAQRVLIVVTGDVEAIYRTW